MSLHVQVWNCGNVGSPAAIVHQHASRRSEWRDADGQQATFSSLLTDHHRDRVQQSTTVRGWALTSITCSGGSDVNNTDLANRTGAVRVERRRARAAVPAPSTTRRPVRSLLVKQTNPDGSPTTFPVHLTRGGGTNNDTSWHRRGRPFVTPTTSIAQNGSRPGPPPTSHRRLPALRADRGPLRLSCSGVHDENNFSLKTSLTNGQRF